MTPHGTRRIGVESACPLERGGKGSNLKTPFGLAIFLVVLALLGARAADAQQIYTCKDAQGRNTYQQVPCEKGKKEQSARRYQPVADAPARAAPAYAPRANAGTTSMPAQAPARQGGTAGLIQAAPVANGAAGAFVRCVGADGSVRVVQGTSCPVRRRTVPHQAGMVTDVRTGQQHFMVPGGGNGMIDPRTGQRHELISPPPTVTYRDRAESISGEEACASARAQYERVMGDFNRSIDQMRKAEDRKRQFCGG